VFSAGAAVMRRVRLSTAARVLYTLRTRASRRCVAHHTTRRFRVCTPVRGRSRTRVPMHFRTPR